MNYLQVYKKASRRKFSASELSDDVCENFVFAVAEEIFIEVLTGKCTFDQFRVQIEQDIRKRTEGCSSDTVEDFLVALFRNDAFFRITAAEGFAEQFLEYVFQIQLSTRIRSKQNGS